MQLIYNLRVTFICLKNHMLYIAVILQPLPFLL